MRTTVLVVLIVLLSVGLVAVISTAWISYSLRSHAVNSDIADGILHVIEQYPHLKPQYDEAMEDGVLTMVEANHILAVAESTPGL